MPVCKIKLCGISNKSDLELACELNVWAIGFVLTQSPRQISEANCKTLCRLAGSQLQKIGVFTSEPTTEIIRLVKDCGLDYAQIHGERSKTEWGQLAEIPFIRAFQIKDKESLSQLEVVRNKKFLLDTFVKGCPGGSGETFDWNLAREAHSYGKVILAGGLNPFNIATAIKAVKPWGVDVSSGIERSKGEKDQQLMQSFVASVRSL